MMMKSLRIATIVIHFFVGVGAFFGGLAAVLNPVSPMGISPETLRLGPFTDFLIPGLTLLIVIGLGNILSGILEAKNVSCASYASGVMGAILIGWIVIQCYILQAVVGLHVLFFLIGCVQGILALASLWITDRFPMNIVRKIIGK
jgi:hypothetical protein